MTVVRKAFAYITHGTRLLVFVHPLSPEAGIQVPAGTMRDDETPEQAVLREAREETGLEGLELVSFLGEQTIDMVSDEGEAQTHHRFFFHLRCNAEPAETWREYEMHDGLAPPTPFDFSWVELPDGMPDLIADHGRYVPELVESLGLTRPT